MPSGSHPTAPPPVPHAAADELALPAEGLEVAVHHRQREFARAAGDAA